MDQQTATEQVELSQQALNALLDARYAAEAGHTIDGGRYPGWVVRELLDAGVVAADPGPHTYPWLRLTDRGRTCGIRYR